ncbi:hypothetical protein [Shewanella mangrovi]|uniref:hypothetical protein n=1 Tax=Shewanella mangrovi TaxID=1515746 RepID=UPI00068B4434|nr:hypothetical protein [Shewanella mangrovi]
MIKIEGVAVSHDCQGNSVQLRALTYGAGSLDVALSVDQHNVSVYFPNVIGCRLLDQSDLAEFWTVCSLSNGWLFQISAGGWFEQESSRSGFMSSVHQQPNEYLMVTEHECVSVLMSKGAPIVARMA